MKAIGLTAYGSYDNLKLMDLKQKDPGKGEVQVRVHASALNPADFKVALGQVKFLHGRNFPMVLGYDFSGVIEKVAPDTSKWKPGDEVFGHLPYGPFNKQGAFAEFLVTGADQIAAKPRGVSFAQAGAAPTPALTALQAIRDLAKTSPGGRILVTGVSGSVGSTAISVAQRLGLQVTALGSARGLEMAKQLGASELIDRTQQDVFSSARGPFNVVFDAAAAYRWRQWKIKIKKGGVYITTLPSRTFFADKISSLLSSSRVEFVSVKSRAQDLQLIADWMSSGLEIQIDSTIPVRDLGSGLARLETGKFCGRIAVDVISGF